MVSIYLRYHCPFQSISMNHRNQAIVEDTKHCISSSSYQDILKGIQQDIHSAMAQQECHYYSILLDPVQNCNYHEMPQTTLGQKK